MMKDITPPMDENTRRYYLDVMGIQCWESLDAQQQSETDNTGALAGKSDNAESNKEVASHSWQQLEESIQQCTQCGLHETRSKALSGRGSQSAKLMFIMLSPSAGDDENGVVCGGAAGELFTKMLAAIDIDIDEIYITSLLKCAPPANHTVSPKEIHSCNDHLIKQVQLVRPELMVVLGETAVRCMLQKDLSIDDFRALNNQGQYQVGSVPLFVSYSPQELLQQAENKRKAWSDLQQLQRMLNQQE